MISLFAVVLASQLGQAAAAPIVPSRPAATFTVGERFDYSAKLGILSLGSASMQVVGIDTVRGQPAYLFRFKLDGGNMFFKVSNTLESWTTVSEFKSLRFRNDNRENDKIRTHDFDIYPDSGFFRQRGRATTEPTPTHPLDDAAFIYFVRSTPLEVGKTYQFDKYFRQDKNPLVIRVLKREEMELPDGTKVGCLVLNPVIDDRGMFADRAEARLWLTDDARRIPVQIRTKYPWGTVTLRLEKMTLPAA